MTAQKTYSSEKEIKEIWRLFRETDRKMQETDRKTKEMIESTFRKAEKKGLTLVDYSDLSKFAIL